MNIVTLPLEDVYPNQRHYREVRPENVAKIAASIAEVGQIEPITVWQDGEIYIIDAGHHRVAAMKSLGRTTVQAIIADAANDSAMVGSNLHIPENELEVSRGTQLLLSTGVRPETAAALTGEKLERVEKAALGMAKLADPVACEDMTLERLAVIAELEDADEIKAVENASEKDWRRVAEGIRRERSEREAVAKAVAIVKESGRELIDGEHPDGLTYLGAFPEPPEAATHGKPTSWGNIYWYGPAGAEPDPEAEEKAKRRAELEAAHVARLEFIGRHLAHTYGTDALTAYAFEAWHDRGLRCEARFIPEEWAIKGPTMFFLAAVLGACEDIAHDAQLGAWNADQKETDRYLAAMKAVGWEE